MTQPYQPAPFSAVPRPFGLYDPRFEHDGCGVSFICQIKGVASRSIVTDALDALCNLDHRGASGAEVNTGDGAGILLQVPDRFLREVVDFALPPAGAYGVGLAFLPLDPEAADKTAARIDAIVEEEGLRVVGWRAVPIDSSMIGPTALSVIPSFRQLFVDDPAGSARASSSTASCSWCASAASTSSPACEEPVYFPSLSCRTLVYKGMLTTPQLSEFFPDLDDDRVESALALVHSRFSTNTFPSWPLAHPYRYLAHNGEINTVQGNRNWMRAREALMATPLIPGLERAFPIVTPGASDTNSFDECLELLHLAGRPIWHAALMMIPGAWENHATMPAEERAFYRFHASLMEPWDGPASITFTDGTVVGAVLDRNGLRPSRYWVTDDDRVIMASEAGVVDVDPAKVVQKGRLQPGRMFLVDTAKGRIVGDREIKEELAGAQPYAEWLEQGLVHLHDLPDRVHVVPSHESVLKRQETFGYTHEDLRLLVAPMAQHRRRGARLHGHRHTDRGALHPLAHAVRLLPAAVRAGHQPAARRHPRGARHLAVVHHRVRGQPARTRPAVVRAGGAAVPDHRQRRAGQAHPHRPRRRPPRVRGRGGVGPLPRRRRRARAARGPRPRARRGVGRHRRRQAHPRAVRPRLRRRERADPVAAPHLRGAPPPHPREDPHARRPRGRDRRRPRGAPHGAPRRVRRGRDQPVPRVRVDRGPHRRGAARPQRAWTRRSRSRTTSRPRARACSR